jgi:uncharacterized membrane protein
MKVLVHPLIVHFPIALWLTSALFDLLYLRSGDRFHFRTAQSLIGLGLLGAVASILSGFADVRGLNPEDIGAAFLRRHSAHSLFAYGATLAYLASFYVRWRHPAVSRLVLLLLTLIGASLIAWTGWLGGELRMVM